MKKNLILAIAFILAVSLDAQDNYKVIRVNGTIQYVRTGNNMSMGDVFSADEDLSFGSPDSRAAVIQPGKGRFILTPGTAGGPSGAKSNFLPAMSNISSRGGALNSMTDLQNQFSEKVAVLYQANWFINPYKFPMNGDRFFFLRFNYKGDIINKKLPFEENKLTFSREEILKVDGNPIDRPDSPETTLYYYAAEGPLFINSFQLVFPDLDEFRKEAVIILDEMAREDYSRKVNEVAGYLYEFYGKPDKEDVMHYLERDFGLQK
jgi:hypothetical protein